MSTSGGQRQGSPEGPRGSENPGIHRYFPRVSTAISGALPTFSTGSSTGRLDHAPPPCLMSPEMGPRVAGYSHTGEGGLSPSGEPLARHRPFPPGDLLMASAAGQPSGQPSVDRELRPGSGRPLAPAWLTGSVSFGTRRAAGQPGANAAHCRTGRTCPAQTPHTCPARHPPNFSRWRVIVRRVCPGLRQPSP